NIVKIFNELFVSANAKNAPMIQRGMDINTTNGYTNESYNITMITYTNKIATINAIPKDPIPSVWFSLSPPHTYVIPVGVSILAISASNFLEISSTDAPIACD